MSASDTLTAELRAEVLHLEDDLRARVISQADVEAKWRAEYDDARASERTSATWEAWVDERVTLAAVAWVLTTVFIRFCEDNGLVKPVWITHSGGRHREALDAQQHFLREAARTNPDVTDREWLLEAVSHLSDLPATAGLVDETSPMWLVNPSGDAATGLLNFWRERDDDGSLLRDLTDPDLDTRFLGDLYQDVSERARKKYALLQTPVFVEEFILDRTLEPALSERPLEGFKAIDPTCGSGHFLLGIFQRLLDRWHRHAPNMDERERVQAALDAVHGVDLNPFAVAVARFRLTVVALRSCVITSLEDAPAFKYHLAAGDSLLHGLDQGEFELGVGLSVDRVAANFAYATENLSELRRILQNGRYDAVVGNPPYIQVKDASLSAVYRRAYPSCVGQYALTIPFVERFFSLAKSGGATAGWTGQITSNSFMKREFGTKLVREFLPSRDLRLVIDSEGAWIPGHNMDGTPTVILVGRNRPPVANTLTAVLSKNRRETPNHVGGEGPYWRGIIDHVDDMEHDDDWLTVVQLDRAVLGQHPWSLSGGGALELRQTLERHQHLRLNQYADSVGFLAITREDDAYLLGGDVLRRRGVSPELARTLVEGTGVRDWGFDDSLTVLCTYDGDGVATIDEAARRLLWPLKQLLLIRRALSGTQLEQGLEWWEYSQLNLKRYLSTKLLAMSEIASHNHFGLDGGERLFSRTSPVVQFKEGLGSRVDVGVLGVLNSSAVSFWLKQVCKPKGGAADHPWSRTYQFNANTVSKIPIPGELPVELAGEIVEISTQLAECVPAAMVSADIRPEKSQLDKGFQRHRELLESLVSMQEELDWEVYELFGVVDDDLTYSGADLPRVRLGERAFEISLARRVAAGEEKTGWFERHGSTPITEIPERWPDDYRALVGRRIELIESDRRIGLLERPEHKRRWLVEPREKQEERALRGWLLDRLEHRHFWFDSHGRPTPQSVATLADEVARDDDMTSVLALWERRPDVPVAKSLESLLAKEAVPYLAAYRYKDSGLRKRADWESTWELQRREDAGTYKPASQGQGGDGPIPVPPKYTSSDFRKPEYWSHRGKLDVPKERFILYPDSGRETDPTPVLGWAGWDHAEQALAVATLIQQRESDGWEDERLVPLVAGLAEVLPWVKQWHDEPDDRFGGANLAEFMAEQLEERMTQVEATADSLKAWRPAPAKKGRKAKA